MLLRLPRGFHQATNGYTRPLPLRPDCGLPCGNSRRLRRDRTDAWYGAGSRNHRSGRSTAGSAAGHRPKGPACHRGGKIPRLYAGFGLSPGRAARGRCCSLLPPVSPSAAFAGKAVPVPPIPALGASGTISRNEPLPVWAGAGSVHKRVVNKVIPGMKIDRVIVVGSVLSGYNLMIFREILELWYSIQSV